MDRLSALIAVLALVACDEPAPATQAGRYETVATVRGDVDQVLRSECDVAHPAASAPTFDFPATTAPVRPAEGKWTWVNLWATWCRPCVEEIPMLRTELDGSSVALVFLSADTSDDALARFRTEHAFEDASPRLTDADPSGAITRALAAVGYRGASSLPVHVLLDPNGKTRCVRAGAVEARNVRAVLAAIGESGRARRIR